MRVAAAVVLILSGAVWILQGLEVAFAPESFMTGDPVWVMWGGAAVAVGLGLVWWERRAR